MIMFLFLVKVAPGFKLIPFITALEQGLFRNFSKGVLTSDFFSHPFKSARNPLLPEHKWVVCKSGL